MVTSIPAIVQRARRAAGRSMASVGAAAGIDRTHLQRFEVGERDLSISKLERLFAELEIAVVYRPRPRSKRGKPLPEHRPITDTDPHATSARVASDLPLREWE